MRISAVIVTSLLAAAGTARADGYCEHVEGVAAAESALMFAPELFGSIGYVEQPATGDVSGGSADDTRVTAGIRYRLTGIYEGMLTRKRAKAECRRHAALDAVQGETAYRAVEARAKVLDEALGEAERMLATAEKDLDARRATAQEVNATRVRVEELRETAAEARRALDALPTPHGDHSLEGALMAFYRADDEVEASNARLRRAKAIDVTVRFGYDKFLALDDESPYFAVLSVGVNLGVFMQGSGNKKAAAGRRRAVREDGSGAVDVTEDRLRSMLAIETERLEETGVLLADLEDQLAALRKLRGDESRRFQETVWFEWVKVKADHEYLTAHVASLRAVLGEGGE